MDSIYEKNIVCAFKRIVKENPEYIAIKENSTALTYKELDERSNLLSTRLIDMGVKKENIVGIYSKKSIDFIVGMLSILKAGAIFLPLDPDMKQHDLNYQVKDAKVKFILSQGNLTQIETFNALNIIDLSIENTTRITTKELSENKSGAYLIYTSGTTGLSKGVLVEHKNIMAYISGIIERINPQKGDNYALLNSLTTDLAYTLVFTSLCTGGCLHVVSQEIAFTSELLTEYIYQNSIDVYKLTPTHFEELNFSSNNNDWIPGKCIIFGGEKLKKETYQKIPCGSCRVINHYGPTETTIGSLTFEEGIESVNENDYNSVPIGKPLSGVETYILDEYFKPVNNYSLGELYIGGGTVTRGYFGKPELTAERYLPNPFSGNDGDILYKTGDIVRRTNDGVIEFVGRLDRQVKLLGYRVELEEVERTIKKFKYIKGVAVTLNEKGSDLIAYIVVEDEINISELKEFLIERLDYFKVPNQFVHLESLPMSSNGKLDYKSLPVPIKLKENNLGLTSHTLLEKELIIIWKEVLKAELIDGNSNFFEVGGHSLLATQITMRIRKKFNIKLPLRQIFETPTLKDLAKVLEIQYKL